MGGLDALVFSGGVGENVPQLRQAATTRLAFLGPALDPVANAADGSDRDLSASGAPGRTLVVHAREDMIVAGQVRRLVIG